MFLGRSLWNWTIPLRVQIEICTQVAVHVKENLGSFCKFRTMLSHHICHQYSDWKYCSWCKFTRRIFLIFVQLTMDVRGTFYFFIYIEKIYLLDIVRVNCTASPQSLTKFHFCPQAFKSDIWYSQLLEVFHLRPFLYFLLEGKCSTAPSASLHSCSLNLSALDLSSRISILPPILS